MKRREKKTNISEKGKKGRREEGKKGRREGKMEKGKGKKGREKYISYYLCYLLNF